MDKYRIFLQEWKYYRNIKNWILKIFYKLTTLVRTITLSDTITPLRFYSWGVCIFFLRRKLQRFHCFIKTNCFRTTQYGFKRVYEFSFLFVFVFSGQTWRYVTEQQGVSGNVGLSHQIEDFFLIVVLYLSKKKFRAWKIDFFLPPTEKCADAFILKCTGIRYGAHTAHHVKIFLRAWKCLSIRVEKLRHTS